MAAAAAVAGDLAHLDRVLLVQPLEQPVAQVVYRHRLGERELQDACGWDVAAAGAKV